jgi:DNA invertase Pin-like site-specific DNA recombinase
MRKMVFTVIGAVAELELSLIRERVVMGLDQVRKQARRLGCTKVAMDLDQIDALRAEGRSWREISRELGLVIRGRCKGPFWGWLKNPADPAA